MNKYILKTILFIVCHLASNNMFCTEVDQEIQLFDIGTRFYNNCQHNAKDIKEYLQDFDRVELHLFWTSGRDPEILQKIGLQPQIQIGGSTYANLFPIALSAFLKYSPENLAVYLVLDSVTQKSNQLSLKLIQERFPLSFHISNIDTVIDNIVKAFPKYEHTIKTVFANATRGNPAIASDIYRLIGMVYGQNPTPAQLNRKLLTYCDVDTFCYGLQHDNHAQLISALFAEYLRWSDSSFISALFEELPQWSDDFLYLSKRADNNDVIKLQISNKSRPLYDVFCQKILDHLRENLESKDITVLNYSSKLHDLIVSNDKQTCDDKFIIDYLSKFRSLQVRTNDIVNVTGPWFLQKLNDFTIIDDFPGTKSLQWHPCYYIENIKGLLRSNHKYLKDSSNGVLALTNFKTVMRYYINIIIDALYIRRCYGENLFVYQELVKFLARKENFPYRNPKFKVCLEEEYKNYYNRVSQYEEDKDHIISTREERFEEICNNIAFYSNKLNYSNLHISFLYHFKYYLSILGVKADFPTQQDLEYLRLKE